MFYRKRHPAYCWGKALEGLYGCCAWHSVPGEAQPPATVVLQVLQIQLLLYRCGCTAEGFLGPVHK